MAYLAAEIATAAAMMYENCMFRNEAARIGGRVNTGINREGSGILQEELNFLRRYLYS